MSPSYTFVGGDGRQYGPHQLETIQSWINEGRLLPDTQMARSDVEGWFRAGDFQELAWSATATTGTPNAASGPAPVSGPAVRVATVPPPGPQAAPTAYAAAGNQTLDPTAMLAVSSRASWFYWIAGLTLINAGSALMGAGFRFVVGTALVDIFMAMGEAAPGVKVLAVVLSALLIGAFALFGVFASRAHRWAFIVGILIYTLDAVLCLVFKEWLSLAFHAWAIWRLVEGLRIAWVIRRAQHA